MSMDKIVINDYILNDRLTNKDSGFSKWGIGERAGEKYFIKEFLAPVYPIDDSMFDKREKAERIHLCEEFVDNKKKLYTAIRAADDGHIVAPEEFFRVGAKYYMTTKAYDKQISIADLQEYGFEDRLRICCAVAHSMAAIHEKGVIHADIKADNVLLVKDNKPKAYIIDFDCSFFDDDKPKPGDELNGDFIYFSPESYLHITGKESNLSSKLDVFSLGILFHQYLTGELPIFDRNEYDYAYESVLDDHSLNVSKVENERCKIIISKMLSKKPEDRPDMRSVFYNLNAAYLMSYPQTVLPVVPCLYSFNKEEDRRLIDNPSNKEGDKSPKSFFREANEDDLTHRRK